MLTQTVITAVLQASLRASVLIIPIIAIRLALRTIPKKHFVFLWFVPFYALLNLFDYRLPIRLNIPHQSYEAPVDYLLNNTSAINGLLSEATEPNDSVSIVFVVWLSGAFAFFICFAARYFSLKRAVSASVNLRDNVWITDAVSTPIVVGVFSPNIYLPSSLLPETEGVCIFHEQTHIKRKDHIFKMLFYSILCIHWFNPLAWVAYYFYGLDVEMACDEYVISNSDKSMRVQYSELLLSLNSRSKYERTPFLIGFSNGAKWRIVNILRRNKRTRSTTVIFACLCLITSFTAVFRVSAYASNTSTVGSSRKGDVSAAIYVQPLSGTWYISSGYSDAKKRLLLSAAQYSSVCSVADGTVSKASTDGVRTMLAIEHFDELKSTYVFSGSMTVAVGVAVSRGQIIGSVDGGGSVTFELIADGSSVNPEEYISFSQ